MKLKEQGNGCVKTVQAEAPGVSAHWDHHPGRVGLMKPFWNSGIY